VSRIIATIGLGSNVGDRGAYLAFGLASLRALPELEELCVSAPYETEHVGHDTQRSHWNACARYHTTLDPRDLLVELQRIEREAGRERSGHGRPRTLDLDLLLHADERIDSPALTLPHPGVIRRRFVLEPLAECCPELVIEGLTVRQRLQEPVVQAQRARRLDGAVLQSGKGRAWTPS